MRSIITVEDLRSAIRNSINGKGMSNEQANELSQHVLNFFGYSDRIIDNVLEPEDRDAFYMLEDAGILTTEREETTLYDGREWRIHYWLFRRQRIDELMGAVEAEVSDSHDEESCYDVLPDDIWQRSKSE